MLNVFKFLALLYKINLHCKVTFAEGGCLEIIMVAPADGRNTESDISSYRLTETAKLQCMG